MTFVRTLSIAALVVSSLAAVGCGGSDASSDGASKVTLAGRLGEPTGEGAIGTRSFGSVSLSSGGVHVAARELHTRGETGRVVDVAVGSDGTFSVDVERGARWVVTVDDADGNSALVTFGDGDSAISVSADSEGGRVDVGSVHVVGGEARTEVVIDGKLGLSATLAEIDEVFAAADGAIIAAREAVEEARKAAEEARKAAEEARDAADAARKAAEEAANAARGGI